MFRKILLILILLNISFFSLFSNANAQRDCTTLGPSDLNTFKEYCYKITDSYLYLRNKFKVDGEIDVYIAGKILNYSKQGLNYLPDDLSNKNYYTHLQTAIERGIKDPKNNSNFDSISKAIEDFLNETKIPEINGDIEVFPATGNAPLTVTFRGNVTDPTGSQLHNYNYTWWVLEGGNRRNIGNNKFLNYTFREEGNYSIFLDVTSNHRNKSRNIDVIPFSKKAQISVKEKIASLILKVNSKTLGALDELKFSPDDTIYGLLFDATSSIPTSGTKFISTEWDFGNGVVKKYDGGPKIERVVYANEGSYNVKLKLVTNTGKDIERNFTIIVRNPIATINASSLEGFLGDKFTFTANSYSKSENLTYFWQIIDLKNDKVLFSKNLSSLTYSFNDKGRYNVKLEVTSPTGQKDYDNKIIHINSRPPVASFTSSIPNPSKPNTVFLDASASYDLDFTDDGKLEYSWIINGDRIKLDNPNFNGSNGYYTFPNIGEQSIVLEVTDPDDLTSQTSSKINILSNLSVEFFVFPRVTQVGKIMRFVADSPKAKFFEWDFGDGTPTVGGKNGDIGHKYTQAGIYTVTLYVRDENDLQNNIQKTVYIGDSDRPYANISVGNDAMSEVYGFEKNVCNGHGAYIINKVDNVTLSGSDSIDVTGQTNGLDYSWKIGDRYYSDSEISRRFDDIGCIPIKLTVKSQKNGKEAVAETYLKVQNLKPQLTGLDIQVKNLDSDPVIVDVRALGAVDRDGVIQSYLWYYYTDVSTEPQDFRATKSPSTTFVLPKITGTYYFVVVLKDNNEDRTSSEDLTSSKYYVTLTGDNINTPIIGVSADNTSVKVGEEIVFTVNVTNILGQNLNKDVKYSWDFDGDGFYDKETIGKNTISHKFTKSGEYRIKVKVKNKGFSNSKNITINVSNILKPDFDYVSIGNDFIFFDKSSGQADSYVWDMGDGNIIDKKGSFIYRYSDGKAIHIVKLKLVEGGKTKGTSKKVVRDFGKMIATKRETLSIFSDYEIVDNKIVLKEEVSSIQMFLRTNLKNIQYYAVDFNIESDSDLNGGKDDDEDNKNTPGYTAGGPIDIKLNNLKVQKIRIFLKDEAGKVIESRDIVIEKEYIKAEDNNINADEIVLEGVSDSLKATFERIKNEIIVLDPENKLKALTYLQRLKEEWNDDFQKASIIKEFSDFIGDLQLQNGNEIISLIEGLLVEDKENKDENSVTLEYLKSIIPKDIVCTGDLSEQSHKTKKTCYDLLVSKLELISENNNLEENKSLGSEILSVIKSDKTLTNEQKVNFRSLLSKIINKDNPPEPGDVPDNEGNIKPGGDGKSSGLIGKIFKFIGFGLLILIGVFAVGFLIYFISYKLKRNNEDQSFTDFVSEKTNNKKEDILADGAEEEKSDFTIKTENNFDPLADISSGNDSSKKAEQKEDKAPDWLKGSQAEVDNSISEEKGSVTENEFSESENTKNTEEISKDKSSDNDYLNAKDSGDLDNTSNNLSGDLAIPDWLLGGSGTSKKTEEKVEDDKDSNNNEKQNQDSVERTSEGDIPNWLKGKESEQTQQEDSLASSDKSYLEKKQKSSSDNGEVPDWLISDADNESDDNKEESLDEKENKNIIDEESKEENLEIINDSVKQDVGEIPDWLKENDLEEPEKESDGKDILKDKKQEDNKSLEKIEKTDDLPDWLKVNEDDSKEQDDNKEEKSGKEKKVTDSPKINLDKKSSIKKDKKQKSVNKNTDDENLPKLDTKEELDELTKIGLDDEQKSDSDNGDLPDWLKGSFGDDKKDLNKDTKEFENNKKTSNKKTDDFSSFESLGKEEDNKSDKTSRKTEKKDDNKKKESKQEDKTERKDDKNSSKEELWDDGMKIPDWLKTDSDN